MTLFEFCIGVALLWLASTAIVAGILAHARRGPWSSPYPPEAAEAPDVVERAYEEAGDTFGFERSGPWPADGHPEDCADDCCYGARLDELVAAYDWAEAEKDIVRPWKGQAR